VEAVAGRFRDQGLSLEDYLRAALKQPSLFARSPTAIIAAVEAVAGRFRDQGLSLEDYLRAALKQPSLFTMAPATIVGHINLLMDMQLQGLVTFPSAAIARHRQPPRSMFDWLVKNPVYLCLADDNFLLREIAAYATRTPRAGTALLTRHRHQVERDLAEALGHIDLKQPVPKELGRNARNVLLRALIREKILQGTLGR